LLDRTWDEFEGVRYKPAQLISRQEAVEWLLQKGIRPPDDLLADAGLTDFTKEAQVSQSSTMLQEDTPSAAQTGEPAIPANGPRIVLRGRDEGPIVLGKPKRKLTTPQYNVVKALLGAGDAGLTKDELVSKSGHEDARGILTRLAEKDPDWKEVIHFAGQTGGGYRIK
jgi:hypothetical protein